MEATKRSFLTSLGSFLIAGALGLLVGVPVAFGGPGVFVYALYANPDTLDSAKSSIEAATHPIWLLCDALVNVSRDGRTIEPGLAESWTVSADGLTVTVKLRPGVVLHDGPPLDGQVVRASVERHFVKGIRSTPPSPRTPRNSSSAIS